MSLKTGFDLTYVVARRLALAYRYYMEAARPIDKKKTLASFNGQCGIAHAIGFGMTPTHVYSVVMDAYKAQVDEAGERPSMHAMSTNEALHAWDAAYATRVADALTQIV